MWVYNSSFGELYRDEEDHPIASGWSGHDEGRNNPALQSHPNLGPIPRGTYTIGDIRENTESHGPFVLPLTPAENTNTFGRDGFLIHGASILNPLESSKGCIILPRATRIEISNSNDNVLEVV